MKKLKLKKVVLKNLDEQSLRGMHGGTDTQYDVSCPYYYTCGAQETCSVQQCGEPTMQVSCFDPTVCPGCTAIPC